MKPLTVEINEVDDKDLNRFLESLKSEYCANEIFLSKTPEQSGSLIKTREGYFIQVPEKLIQEDLKSAKVVIAHEFNHYLNEHRLKHISMEISSIITLSLIYIISIIYTTQAIGLLILLILIPIFVLMINYNRQKYEYQSDSFASKTVSKEAVLNRLNQHYNNKTTKRYLRYFSEYPPSLLRLSKQSDGLESDTKF